MKRSIQLILGLATTFCTGFAISTVSTSIAKPQQDGASKSTINITEQKMKLGAFSVSLSVKDIETSKQFYENLGFTVTGGDISKRYLIMRSENCLIGLFQGMFEKNILTFNPGWDESANKIEVFDDVRVIQQRLKSKGIKLQSEVDEKSSGAASFIVVDPDGNPILFDQHIAK